MDLGDVWGLGSALSAGWSWGRRLSSPLRCWGASAGDGNWGFILEMETEGQLGPGM